MKTKHFLLPFIFLCLLLPSQVQAQDIYEVKFIAGVTQYRAAMALFDDGTGLMRVRYYSNGTKMVEQSLILEETTVGIRVTGYDPVYPGTNTPHPSYNADNFYISQDEYGDVSIVNIDDNGVTASATMRLIEGYYAKQNFLDDFNWKL